MSTDSSALWLLIPSESPPPSSYLVITSGVQEEVGVVFFFFFNKLKASCLLIQCQGSQPAEGCSGQRGDLVVGLSKHSGKAQPSQGSTGDRGTSPAQHGIPGTPCPMDLPWLPQRCSISLQGCCGAWSLPWKISRLTPLPASIPYREALQSLSLGRELAAGLGGVGQVSVGGAPLVSLERVFVK